MHFEKYATDVQGVFINIDWSRKSIQDLQAIDLNAKFLMNGIVFMWSDKELLSDIIDTMAAKQFKYIENICIAMIDAGSVVQQPTKGASRDAGAEKLACMDQLRTVSREPEECFLHEDRDRYIRCCKKVVLMFHRVDTGYSRI